MSNIDQFKSYLKSGGARPNLFRVEMNFPGFVGGDNTLASFMIKGAALPASIITPIEVPYRGRKLKIAGDRTFEPWTITVINDTNMEIRNAFERWMSLINGNAGNTSQFRGNGSLNYMTDINVHQLDRNDSITKSYVIYQAWPSNISQVDLNYETNDTVEEFTVELSYQYWLSPNSTLA